MTDVNAKLTGAKISHRKVALVVNQIRGKKVGNALDILTFETQKSAHIVKKVLNSAIANAENNKQLDIDNLFVKEAYVGKSLSMKRFRPRAKGRASSIVKPFSKLTIIVEEKKISQIKKESK
jgi:large subunit ribosomal protein L22